MNPIFGVHNGDDHAVIAVQADASRS